MSASPTLSTHDLRSDAIDAKRDRDHAAKWARGEVDWPKRRPEQSHQKYVLSPFRQPTRADTSPFRVEKAQRRSNQADVNRTEHRANRARNYDIRSGCQSSDSSSPSSDDNEDTAEVAADAEITYSFDAPQGPQHGSRILGMALTKAVERFEGKETEKLIRTEYEIIDEDPSAEPEMHEDDGFELV